MALTSPEWLQPALTYAAQWIGFQMRAADQPGCAMAVVRDGTVVFEQAWGEADRDTGEKLSTRHRFRIASHSKTFTAAGIMKLREAGRLRLDDTVGEHVPGLHGEIAAATIGQVLSHTAGLFRDGDDTGFWRVRDPFPDEARVRAHLAEVPAIAANTRMKYSNYGFALAGLVIEHVTGEAWGDWIRREVVAAAGLGETEPDGSADTALLAHGHSGKQPLGRRVVIAGDMGTGHYAPATGFLSTAAETARFFGQLDPAAADSILSAGSRREMTRAHWRVPHAAVERHYGLGTISGRSEGLDWFGHSGGFPGTITRTCVVPAHRLAISVFTNAIDGPSDGWMEGVLHILACFAKGGAPAPALADWRGRWWNLWHAVDLVPVGGKVLIAIPALGKPLDHAGEITVGDGDAGGGDEGTITEAGGFASHGEKARLLRDGSGFVRGVWLAGGTLMDEADARGELEAGHVSAIPAIPEPAM